MHCWKPEGNACSSCGIFSPPPKDSGLILHPWEAVISYIWKISKTRRLSFNSGKAVVNCIGLYTTGRTKRKSCAGFRIPREMLIPHHCLKTHSETHLGFNSEVTPGILNGENVCIPYIWYKGSQIILGVILPLKPFATLC